MLKLEELSKILRSEMVSLAHLSDAMHIGSSLSCLDILLSLYFSIMNIDPKNPDKADRDRCILSKGHASMAQYIVLAEKGYFPKNELSTFNVSGSRLTEHPNYQMVPGVEATSGSLGHGLPIGLGMALASKINNIPYRVFVIISDGECNEGSVWEAALLAPALKLNNLIVIIDFNRWQATGRSEEITALEPLEEKWKSFGWSTSSVDGNDISLFSKTVQSHLDHLTCPVAIIAHTVKGKGILFMEDDNNWHYRIPTAEEAKLANKELMGGL